jgi:hypothetical protein
MKYLINQRVGVVHTADCPSVRRIAPENLSDWDPAKAHLAPGVQACPACLSKVPAVEDPLRGLTVEKINRLLSIDIWQAPSFRADVRIDFDENGKVLSVALLNSRTR